MKAEELKNKVIDIIEGCGADWDSAIESAEEIDQLYAQSQLPKEGEEVYMRCDKGQAKYSVMEISKQYITTLEKFYVKPTTLSLPTEEEILKDLFIPGIDLNSDKPIIVSTEGFKLLLKQLVAAVITLLKEKL